MSSDEQVDGKKETDNKNTTTVTEERCSVCTQKNRSNCAEKYCIECNDYYCNVCVTLHEEIPALSNHQLIEKKDFTSESGRLQLPSIPTERYRAHRTNTVDMYCIDHDTVGCHTCLSLGHGHCKKLYIPENIGQLSQASGDKAEIVKQEAIELRERLLMAFKRRQTDKRSVQIKHENAKQSIKNFRKELKKKLQELEVSMVAVLDLECDIFVQKLDEEIKSLSHFVQKLDDNIGNLKISSESNNTSQLFVALQILSKDISETKSVYKAMSAPLVKDIDFRPDESLTKSIQCLENLGTIDFNSIDKPAPLWEIKSAEDISVRTAEDTKDCSIKSACITRLGHILLVDSNNSNIKLFDRGAQKVVDTCTVETTAWYVCNLEENKSIISLPRAKRVMIIEADDQIKPTGFIHIGYKCFAIAYSMKELYISDEHGSVIVHSTSGDILRRY
ncbi:E3 ubiquitin-protein ligase TRIM71-like [Mercenaria mercenaria]|uniref:E3 ubiquitin-protein ligase TRIM71-like n=1 Tax=Mercenaria mercenaria TaxID=6596 RepID=UPI00234FAC37|nr:E3 ubiquitin-protein ligase TRIM71-like [Mercenaria mercenaria]